MKLGLINSAWAQSGRGHRVRHPQDPGDRLRFDRHLRRPARHRRQERRLIKDECDVAGLPIISVACVAVGLVDFNPSVRRFHVERVKAYLDMAYGCSRRGTCCSCSANTSGRRR